MSNQGVIRHRLTAQRRGWSYHSCAAIRGPPAAALPAGAGTGFGPGSCTWEAPAGSRGPGGRRAQVSKDGFVAGYQGGQVMRATAPA